jgi:hypothetical protein
MRATVIAGIEPGLGSNQQDSLAVGPADTLAVGFKLGNGSGFYLKRRRGPFRLVFPLAHFQHRHDKTSSRFKGVCHSHLLKKHIY